jgi:broad specificity phosphatase PhoE
VGTLYLVRHGQASFGADNYDQLSPLGYQQSVRLGEYFKKKKLSFDHVMHGTLDRQAQTLKSIAQGMGVAFEKPVVWPGLNEYNSEAMIKAIHPEPLPKPNTPELYREHFRLLRDSLVQWMKGELTIQGMLSYPEFLQGITSALDYVKTKCEGSVLMVSSGGPISNAIGQLLGADQRATVELNMRIRNTAVSELEFNLKRHVLLTFNTVHHLDGDDIGQWLTYA